MAPSIDKVRGAAVGVLLVAGGLTGGVVGVVVVAVVAGGLYAAGFLSANRVFLQGDKVKLKVPLIEKEAISHDVRRLRFALPTPQHTLGLPLGKHIHVSAEINGELEVRAYTPVSNTSVHGYFDLVVKVYFKDVHPKFPAGGKMSQYFDALPLGATIDIRGPSGNVEYVGAGQVSVSERKKETVIRKAKRIGMIAGGTGITPMLQLIQHILNDPNDKTELFLLFANQTEEDIFLRKELEEFAKNPQLKLWYTVDRPPANWTFSTGFIDEPMLQAHMPAADADSLVLMCGPPPMIKFACIPNLEKLGFKAEQFITF